MLWTNLSDFVSTALRHANIVREQPMRAMKCEEPAALAALTKGLLYVMLY